MKGFILILSVMACSLAAVSQSFINVNAGMPGLANSQSLDWGDYDNDGDLDLLIAGQSIPPDLTPVCKLFKYENFAFTEVPLTLQGKYHAKVKFVDFDNDGDLDYIISGSDTYFGSIKTFVALNEDGNFINPSPISYKGGFFAIGDLDNDGDPDVLLSGTIDVTTLCIIRNDCIADTFYFHEINLPSTPLKFSTVALADFDQDNDLDIIVSGEGEEISDYHVLMYRNDSALNFSAMPVDLPHIRGFISVADFDNDNDQDILISGVHDYNVPITSLFRNDNNWNFTSVNAGLPQVNGVSAFADLNNDTYTDIILPGISGSFPDFITETAILKNNGNETFTLTEPVSLPLQAGSLATGDYDADGDVDFALSGGNTFSEPVYSTIVYANNYILSNEKEPLINVTLYPNPVSDVFKIQFQEPAKEVTLSLFTSSGQLLGNYKYSNCTSIEHDISTLAKGVYLLTIKTGSKSACYKIIR